MSRVILMIGAPASGKSTYAKEHKGEKDIYISRDEVRFSIIKEGEDYFSKETMVYNQFIDMINHALQIEWVENIWVDATHLTPKSRTKIIRRLLPLYTDIDAVFMNTPKQLCITRNEKREGRTKVPRAQMERMFDTLTPPAKREGFSKITVINEGYEYHYE